MTDDAGIELEAGDGAVAWEPDASYLERSRLLRFARSVGLESYEALLPWADADPGRYWDAVVRDLEFGFDPPYSQAVDLSKGKPWPEWFVGGGFNYVTFALDRHLATAKRDETAVVWEGDDGEIVEWTFAELAAETNRVANALIELGISRGDRIGIFLPMVPETVAAVLACGKIGAIYTPMFSGYGE
jgi:acetyl-CoA synthetase